MMSVKNAPLPLIFYKAHFCKTIFYIFAKYFESFFPILINQKIFIRGSWNIASFLIDFTNIELKL